MAIFPYMQTYVLSPECNEKSAKEICQNLTIYLRRFIWYNLGMELWCYHNLLLKNIPESVHECPSVWHSKKSDFEVS